MARFIRFSECDDDEPNGELIIERVTVEVAERIASDSPDRYIAYDDTGMDDDEGFYVFSVEA